MRPNAVAWIFAAASLCATIVACIRWEHAGRRGEPQRAAASSPHTRGNMVSDSALAEAEELTVTNDPFRLSNAPPSVRYDPANEGGASGLGTVTPPPVRPTLTLKAIVGGPPWTAVIDGIPGQAAGTIARQGTTFDKLTVRVVTRDSVVVQGPDTAWVLSFKGRS